MYDPDTMPADLRKAHKALDVAVDGLYRKKPFTNDRERVEHLLKLYEEIRPEGASESEMIEGESDADEE